MIAWDKKPCIYTIPPGVSFADSLAKGILDMAGDDPLALAQYQILLPTRRACRSLREAFLKISEGKPLLLPRLHPIGDVDDEELSLLLAGSEDELSLSPALPPLRRQFMLTRLIAARQDYSRGLEQDLMLANALGRLMDQVYTEGLNLADLPHLVSDGFAKHWEISTKFLSILSEAWPAILAENGVMDAADRRDQLIKKLAAHWRAKPPGHPVIAAGSTGSIPATLELLQTIAGMDKGCIVLPGLDQIMDSESWDALDDTHPQSTLKHLLQQIGTLRENVKEWPWADKVQQKIAALTTEIMRPADTAAAWQNLKTNPVVAANDLNIERYDCANPQEEALIIALALRRALEAKPKMTAAMVTTDRNLARRVAMACRRWGIEVDDSAGVPLSQTPIGIYLRSTLNAAMDHIRPVSLLSFAKHNLCRPEGIGEWRSKIRDLDRSIMRGTFAGKGLEAYLSKIAHMREEAQKRGRKVYIPAHSEKTLKFIDARFAPLLQKAQQGAVLPIADWCEAYILCAEAFSDPNLLWSGPAGEKAAAIMAEIRDEGGIMPPLTLQQYAMIVEQAMGSVNIRPAYGLHPRLFILGQLEARLVQTDLMILSGLNEGSWPPDPGVDPWMSRPMRRKFGLPPLERTIGLAAHDFVQAFCAPQTILTRAVRVDGTPTVPARWLQRLDTVLQACGMEEGLLHRGALMSYARALADTAQYTRLERPAPTPPVSVRPRELPVTAIELWMQDPYSIYAKYILGLYKLSPLEQKLDAAARGTLVHAILERFNEDYPNDIPSHAEINFLSITKDELARISPNPAVSALWMPRLARIGQWVVKNEREWRMTYQPAVREAKGDYKLPDLNFTMTARADRIDLTLDGTAGAIIDYKSGGTFSPKKMEDGRSPQLPLEALILQNGNFAGIKQVPVTDLSYWVLKGNHEGGEKTSLSDPLKLARAIENAADGLSELIQTFDHQETAYYSLPRPHNIPAYNDYEHLARVKEWTALDEGEAA